MRIISKMIEIVGDNQMNKILTVLILLLFAGLLDAEKIYKWVDEDGQIHYSSQKPAGQEVEKIKVSKGPKVATTATTAEAESEKKGDELKKDAEADAAAKAQLAKADQANRKKMCEQARNNLAALNATIRVNTVDEKTGQTVRMTDDQRVAAMKNAQQGIKEYCQ